MHVQCPNTVYLSIMFWLISGPFMLLVCQWVVYKPLGVPHKAWQHTT